MNAKRDRYLIYVYTHSETHRLIDALRVDTAL